MDVGMPEVEVGTPQVAAYATLAALGALIWLTSLTVFIRRRNLFPIDGRDWLLSALFSTATEISIFSLFIIAATASPCGWAAYVYYVSTFWLNTLTCAHVTRTWVLLAVARERLRAKDRPQEDRIELNPHLKDFSPDKDLESQEEEVLKPAAMSSRLCVHERMKGRPKPLMKNDYLAPVSMSWLARHEHWFRDSYLLAVASAVAFTESAITTVFFAQELASAGHNSSSYECPFVEQAQTTIDTSTGVICIPFLIGVFKLWSVTEGYKIKTELKMVASAIIFWVAGYVARSMNAAPPEYHTDVEVLILWFANHIVVCATILFPVYISYTNTYAPDVVTSKSGALKRKLPHNRVRKKSRSECNSMSSSDSGFALGDLLHDPMFDEQHQSFREYLVSTHAIEGYLFYFAVCKFQEVCARSAVFPEYSVSAVLEDRRKFKHKSFDLEMSIPDSADRPHTSEDELQPNSIENSTARSLCESSENSSNKMRNDLGLDFMNMSDEGIVQQAEPLSPAARSDSGAKPESVKSTTIISLVASSDDSANLETICQWAVGLYCEFVMKSAAKRANFPSNLTSAIHRELEGSISNLKTVARRWRKSRAPSPKNFKLEIVRAPSPRMFDDLKLNAYEIMAGDPFVRFQMPSQSITTESK